MLIDYERVVLGLKAHIATKRTHGQVELLRVLNDLEVESRVPEGQEGYDDRPRVRSALPLDNGARRTATVQ